MREPSILIVEERSSGHLLVYVRIVLERVLFKGLRATLALSDQAFASEEYRVHLEPLVIDNQKVRIVRFSPNATLRAISNLASSVGANAVIVPHGDELAVRVGWARAGLRGIRLVLLVMRDPSWEVPAPFHRRLRNFAKKLLLEMAARRKNVELVWLREPNYRDVDAKKAFAIDPFVADGSRDEIACGAQSLRADLGLDDDVFWFGVTGAISSRKNLPLVVDAMVLARALDPSLRIGLVVFGPIGAGSGVSAAQLEERCDQEGIPVVVRNELITNFRMNCLVKGVDAVVMAYSSHSPNSTLGKAYVLGTRLVAAGPPSVRRFVDSLGMGPSTALQADALARRMATAILEPRPREHFGELAEDAFADALLRSAWQ